MYFYCALFCKLLNLHVFIAKLSQNADTIGAECRTDVGGDFIGATDRETAVGRLNATKVATFEINKPSVFQGLGIVDDTFNRGDDAEGDFVAT